MKIALSNFRQTKLDDFPEYDVRLMLSHIQIRRGMDPDNTISKYSYFGSYYNIGNKLNMLVRSCRKSTEASGVAVSGNKLRIDNSCRIPTTLLKPHYTIITSRSTKTPDFTVIGDIKYSACAFKVFVSHEMKLVLCLNCYCGTDETKIPDLQTYRDIFRSCIEEIGDKCDTFYPYTTNPNDNLYIAEYSKGAYDFINKMLPDTSFVHEKSLITGTKAVTSDMLISVMKMLESPDGEIRDAALVSLASSDYSRCRDTVGYLLSKYHLDTVIKLKGKSSAVKWLANMCDISRYYSFHPLAAGEANLAKDYLLKSSGGKVHYTDEPYRHELHCDDTTFLMRNNDFIKRIPDLHYDLTTANLVAARL